MKKIALLRILCIKLSTLLLIVHSGNQLWWWPLLGQSWKFSTFPPAYVNNLVIIGWMSTQLTLYHLNCWKINVKTTDKSTDKYWKRSKGVVHKHNLQLKVKGLETRSPLARPRRRVLRGRAFNIYIIAPFRYNFPSSTKGERQQQ